MKPVFTCLIIVIVASFAVASLAENKGICPPSPPVETHHTNSRDQSGNITLQAAVSDTGYVCSAKVIGGIDKKSDADAERVVREWHFAPAKKDGHPVPVVVAVEVHYERDKDGNNILSSHQPTPTEQAPKQ
jgi:Gram-negative bacterial TonB protein C-terminal